MNKTMPAYGKKWADLRRKGLAPRAGVFDALVLLDHWKIVPVWPFLVVPDDKDPGALDFTVLEGRTVTLAYLSLKTPIERVTTAVDAILRDGAEIVATLDRSCRDRGTVQRKENSGRL